MSLSWLQSAVMNSTLGFYEIRAAEAKAKKEADDLEAQYAREDTIRGEELQNKLDIEEAKQAGLTTREQLKIDEENRKFNAINTGLKTRADQLNASQNIKIGKDGLPIIPKDKKVTYYFVTPDNKLDKHEYDNGQKKLEPYSPNLAFGITNSKTQEAVPFPLGGSRNEVYKKFRLREERPELGKNITGWIRAKGLGEDQNAITNMRSISRYAFVEDGGWLKKFHDAKNEEGVQWVLGHLEDQWEIYAKQIGTTKLNEFTERRSTPLSFIPEESRQLLVEVPGLMKFFMKTIDPAIGLTANQVLRMAGATPNNPATLNLDGTIDESVKEYPNLAINYKKDGVWSPEFVDAVSDFSMSSGIATDEVYDLLDGMGSKKSQEFIDTIREAHEHFAENPPLEMQGSRVVINAKNLSADQTKIMKVLSYIPDARTRHKVAQGLIGDDIIDGLPGETRGRMSSTQLIAQDVTKVDFDKISGIKDSSNLLAGDIRILMQLIKDKGVKGGLTGAITVTGSGIAFQVKAILERFGSADLGPLPINEEDRKARREYLDQKAETLRQIASGKVEAEKLYQALTNSLMYGVASMLQGGDFRNISDQDIVLSGRRMGGLTDLLSNPETSLPVLRQLLDLAETNAVIADGFLSNDAKSMLASAMMYKQRTFMRVDVDNYLMENVTGLSSVNVVNDEQAKSIVIDLNKKGGGGDPFGNSEFEEDE